MKRLFLLLALIAMLMPLTASAVSLQGVELRDGNPGIVGPLGCDNGGTSATSTGPTAWTPVLKFGGGTTGITYANQIGTYSKACQFVTASFRITLTAVGSSTGTATVTGFPATGTAQSLASASCGYYLNMTSATGITGVLDSTGTLTFNIPGATATANATNTNFSSTSDISCSVTYSSSS